MYRQQVRVHMHAVGCNDGCSDCSDYTNDKNDTNKNGNGVMQMSLGIAEFMTKHRM